MPRPTDIRIRETTLYFLPVETRVPLKFGTQTVTTLNGLSWTLADLTTITTPVGFYQLDLIPTGSPIIDVARLSHNWVR